MATMAHLSELIDIEWLKLNSAFSVAMSTNQKKKFAQFHKLGRGLLNKHF